MAVVTGGNHGLGRVVNVSSGSGAFDETGTATLEYGASKTWLNPMTREVALEAEVVGETSRFLSIQGECRRPGGTVVALCRTKLIVVEEEALDDT